VLQSKTETGTRGQTFDIHPCAMGYLSCTGSERWPHFRSVFFFHPRALTSSLCGFCCCCCCCFCFVLIICCCCFEAKSHCVTQAPHPQCWDKGVYHHVQLACIFEENFLLFTVYLIYSWQLQWK
jgi:hypothetical protein